ncbi:MAG TPA: thiamine diphosphokinase [Thermoflexia bacterium]|nr:thiamine diphosphokinase [Thermoflexia bacterium]
MVKEAEPSRWQGGSFVMRAVLFVNGDLPEPETARRLVQTADLVVAVDGGSRHVLALGVFPHVVIGDLDSLEPDLRVRLAEAGTRFLSYPPEKDETDLELALLYAVERGAKEVFVLGALGKRIDQTVANLLLLAHPALAGVAVRIVAGNQEAFLIRDEGLIEGRPGDTVSLIPIGGDARGVTAEGLKWPLADETLRFGPARGISNVLLGREARVRVREGFLLCVVIHKSHHKEAKR